MILDKDVFQIGYIKKLHGTDGEVEMSITDDIFDRVDADYLFLKVDGLYVPFFIEEYRFKSNETVLMKFDGVASMKQAEAIVKCGVYFPHELVRDDVEAPLTWNVLTGFTLRGKKEGEIGRVVGVDDSSANILLAVAKNGGGELLLPFHPDLVEDYSEKERYVTLNIPDGLLTINE